MATDTLRSPGRANGTMGTATGGTPTAAPHYGENPVATRRNGFPEGT